MSQIKQPKIWPPSSYVRPIQVITDGQRAQTHLAELRSPDGAPCRAYVKHFGSDSPRSLFNEWFGYTLMSAFGVPQPEAAILQAPVVTTGANHLGWAFASCQPMPSFDGTPKQIFLSDPACVDVLRKRLYGCHSLPLMIAADQLVKNGDRNLGNLVFTGKHNFVAIDHSDVLGGPDWAFSDTYFSQTWVCSKLIEQADSLENLSQSMRSALVSAAGLVSEAWFERQNELKDVLGYQSSSDVAAALDMVWWRSLELEDWFKEKLGLLT